MKEYKVIYLINDNKGLFITPKTLISKEVYDTLGVFQDRVEITEIQGEAEKPTLEILNTSEKELEELRAEYLKVFGKKPHHLKNIDTLRNEIASKLVE